MPALVLAGHGSHLNPDSARPVYDHADRLREDGPFEEVRETFWKEEPSLRNVLRTVESETVVVVPLFMAEGYFTEQVLPRELRLDDGRDLDVAATVRYAEPVGTHDAMTDVVLERARSVLDADSASAAPDPAESGLAVVGHGTERNENSAATTEYHARRAREQSDFAEVRALFMDEEPEIDDLTDHFESEDVAVVPLFLADGYHTQEDIPEDAGLTDDFRTGWDVPAEVDGHRVWYSGAVGTEPLLADVALERAREALADDNSRKDAEPNRDAHAAFLRWLEGDHGANGEKGAVDADGGGTEEVVEADGGHVAGRVTREWGQLALTVERDSGVGRTYEVRHVADRGADRATLDVRDDPLAAREIARFDADGEYRPLSTRPDLPDGWVFPDLSGEALVRTVEEFYPASIANWERERAGELDVTHFREAAERQTGIYEIVAELDEEAVESAAAACCADSECLKRREWEYEEDEPLDAPAGDGAIPCREPCSLFVAAAREFAKIEREADDADRADDPHGDDASDGADGRDGEDDARDGADDASDGADGQRGAVADVADGDRPRIGDVSDEANRYRTRYCREQFGDS